MSKKAKKPEKLPEKAVDIEPEALVVPVTPDQIEDRMLRYSKPSCPECDAFPVVCMGKRGPVASYRCRMCGHRWEVGA